ncbi:MAG TPA: hypothetical protein VKA55_06330 [Gammaproteobacteria bacterium]|nr:hypothetical protein [Gammaproteobacteria bacterium]
MSDPAIPDLPRYRRPHEPGPDAPMPPELDTVEGWRGRARLVRPEAEPEGELVTGGHWAPLYPRRATVPIESDADLDATSAYPANSRVPGVYDYGSPQGSAEGETD